VFFDFYVLSFDCVVELDFGDECDLCGVVRDDELGGWVGFFVMVGFNMCIVWCSNVL